MSPREKGERGLTPRIHGIKQIQKIIGPILNDKNEIRLRGRP